VTPNGPPSRRILRGLWGLAPTEEESRAFLQARLTALFKLMFWSLVALVGFLWGLYTAYPADAPERRNLVYLIACAGLALMAFIWRVLLVRRPLSVTGLYRIDLVYSVGIGSAFGAAAYLQEDLRASGYLSVFYSTFTVFARALIVPSSGRRTAITSSASMLPMTIAAIALAILTTQDVPGPVYLVGYLLFCIVPIVLATAGSSIIYGLRRQVSAAQQLGQYRLDRKIAQGAVGAVYLAHHVMLRRPTAIKLVLPDRVGRENLERFEREVHHMSTLTHPNTVAVYDYGRSADGVFYYAMEYLAGGIDLERLVVEHGPQPAGRVAMILDQICGALHEAHGKNIIHRDLRPANVILCERGGMPDVAKVADYGLINGVSVPEPHDDPEAIGPAVDIHALGVVGYHLLTGSPLVGDRVPGTTAASKLEAVLARCIAPQPADRFATVAQLRAALRALSLDDWSDAAARGWWRAVRDGVLPGDAASSGKLTIAVELVEREREHRVNQTA
jgi:hypothetical protein